MRPTQDFPVSKSSILVRFQQLQKRKSRVELIGIFLTISCFVSVVGIFFQQDLIFHFWGLTDQIKTLHVPASFPDHDLIESSSDYFGSLLSWFIWFIFKCFVAFVGAFYLYRVAKKMQFFKVRFRRFSLKIVGWLVSFMMIWSGLSYVQSWNNDENAVNQELVSYKQNIQNSQMAQHLTHSNAPQPVKDYLLAQTALLHKPVDKDAAIFYLSQLTRAERQDAHFMEYGFSPEQLWSMQTQVYGKAVTPFAQSMKPQLNDAQKISVMIDIFLKGLSILLVLSAFIFWLLVWVLNRRIKRLERNL